MVRNLDSSSTWFLKSSTGSLSSLFRTKTKNYNQGILFLDGSLGPCHKIFVSMDRYIHKIIVSHKIEGPYHGNHFYFTSRRCIKSGF
jgi:hypothetical protein